jgi:PAS domain-containing protein
MRGDVVDGTLLAAVLDSLREPILYADTGHVIRYMNRAAVAHYRGGEALLGSSLLDCHNPQSQQMILQILAAMQEGEDERLYADNEKHRVYMRAVRGPGGELLGYYEWYEPPGK